MLLAVVLFPSLPRVPGKSETYTTGTQLRLPMFRPAANFLRVGARARALFIYLFPVCDNLFGKCRGGSRTARPDGNRACTVDITRLLLVRVAQLSSSFASPARARQKERPAPRRETVRRGRRETFSRSFNGRGFSEASPAAKRRNNRSYRDGALSLSLYSPPCGIYGKQREGRREKFARETKS